MIFALFLCSESTHKENKNSSQNKMSRSGCDWCTLMPPAVSCLFCEAHLCAMCSEQLHCKPQYKKHKRVAFTNTPFTKRCQQPGHERELLTFYCRERGEAMCQTCAGSSSHTSHGCVPFSMADLKANLAARLVPMQAMLKAEEKKLAAQRAAVERQEHLVGQINEATQEPDVVKFLALFAKLPDLGTPVAHLTPVRTWHLREDWFKGLRQSTFDPRFYFAVAQDPETSWEAIKNYEVPPGFRWATTAEGMAAFTDTGRYHPFVYYSQGGWEGCDFQGKTRCHFLFSDSYSTQQSKYVNSGDGYAPQWWNPISRSHFAGLVLIKE